MSHSAADIDSTSSTPYPGDPPDPDLKAWLRSLEPRQELVFRQAMQDTFPAFRSDREFAARYRQLLRQARPTATEKVILGRRATRLAEKLVALASL